MDETNEVWRPVLGFEGCYEVSNLGRVRSIARIVQCRNGRRMAEGRVLKPKLRDDGYYFCVSLSNGANKLRHANVHRLVAEAFVAGIGQVVRHLDGNSHNNAASNLAWGSYEDNEADKRRHGRIHIGEKHHNAVLNDELVRQIRFLHSRGHTQLKIAASLGLGRGVVGTVVRGEHWKHVT